jgi:hypothetical protein
MKGTLANMTFNLHGVGALLLCISVTAHAAETSSSNAVATATKFVDELRHQRYKEAASMFVSSQAQDRLGIGRTLKRIDESVGGFSTMHPIPTLPDGKTIKLEVPAHKTIVSKVQKSLQVRYVSTASDGQPVFYELNLSAENTPPQVLSFGVHFPASAPKSTVRANHLISFIER